MKTFLWGHQFPFCFLTFLNYPCLFKKEVYFFPTYFLWGLEKEVSFTSVLYLLNSLEQL